MNECSSIEVTNMYPNLKDQTTIRLNETNKIKGYFNSEIQERKIMSKLLLLIFWQDLFYLEQVEEYLSFLL